MGFHLSQGKWTPASHLKLLSEYLVDASVGRRRRVIVSMPPRHGKSNLISTWYPTWYLNLWPDRRVILTSYEASFASSWGRRVRNLIDDNQAWLDVRLAKDLTAADWWETTAGGGMMTAGVGGAITGKGADILIVDDPVKNAEDAHSQTMRDKTFDWWQSTAYTRLEPNGSAIILMTRWHEDDLAGRLLATGEWDYLSLPALAEENDPLGRDFGEPLWPERFNNAALSDIKRSVGTYVWNALYQQRPAPIEGAIVKRDWWRRYDSEPDGLTEHVLSVDCSFSGKESSDFVVFQCWAKRGADRYLLAQIRGRWDFPQTLERFKAFCAKHPQAQRKLIEAKANGQALIDSIKREIAGVIPINPKDSKESRVHAVSAQIESGNVYVPRASWADEVIEEFAAFPSSVNDDQVDAATQALSYMAKPEFKRVITRPT